jgi:hypothetical protein
MRRFLYKSPRIIDSTLKNYVPIFKNILVDEYNPSVKTVLIEVFYTVLFSHHLPILFRGGGIFGEIKLISFESYSEFFRSYIGKILFYTAVFYILHFIVLRKIKKIDIKKFM